jgi:protein Tex
MTHPSLLAYICEDTSLSTAPVKATLSLFDEGATIPFIARYRKERTSGLDETQIRLIQTRYDYYTVFFSRQETILKTIREQGKLTPQLSSSIEQCRDKQRLEDLYLPYKQRRKTKADVAVEMGFDPLAQSMLSQKSTESRQALLREFKDPDAAIQGAQHIIAQSISDNAEYRLWIRNLMMRFGLLKTKVTTKFKGQTTKFDMYYDFSESLCKAASHRLLAVRRGEKEKVLNWKVVVDEGRVFEYLENRVIKNRSFALIKDVKQAIQEAYAKSLSASIQKECFNQRCEEAEKDSITVFSKNFKNLLMASPAGTKVIMGIDPGFRTGCKIAIVDKTGTYKTTATIFPVPPHANIAEAEKIVLQFIEKYQVDLIAIGNGTGSKETSKFIKKIIRDHGLTVKQVVVNESGASVYSASELAIEEYPDLDVTVRGAISIAHRLQDPLAELVKIDPKSIGVGQYQHDVNQTQLKDSLSFTTEMVVNTIGVDLNTASKALLTYISGIGPSIAQNIVEYRNKNGAFKDRKTVLKVAKLGAKAFEQCAGFLRIKTPKNPLDNSSIHPESYALVMKMAKDAGVSIETLIGNEDKIKQIDLSAYITDSVGLPTLKDIVKELVKPGVDPRAIFDYASFDDSVDDITDLKIDMSLEGVVTNVTNFGAFVDIGVHQDGLIHISKLSNTFVKNPQEIISVGEKVSVTVIGVDIALKRIQLARVI